MPLEIRQTGEQKMTQAGVDEFLRQVRSEAKRTNPRVLGLHLHTQMIARNNGYPKTLYHQDLDTVIVRSEEEELALAAEGFRTEYIRKDYPRFLFRRNLDPRFAEKVQDGSLVVMTHHLVEERQVRTAADEERLRKEATRKGQGKWYLTIAEVLEHDPLSEESEEDMTNKIARLEGELTARRENDARKGK